MKNTVHDLSDYRFRKDDALLLDTNVWLYLNPAPSDQSLATSSLSRQYSEAFKAMLSARSLLIMDALVLGEYLNRYCRIVWNALHKRLEAGDARWGLHDRRYRDPDHESESPGRLCLMPEAPGPAVASHPWTLPDTPSS